MNIGNMKILDVVVRLVSGRSKSKSNSDSLLLVTSDGLLLKTADGYILAVKNIKEE